MLGRAAIRRLRTGLVPSWEVERLSVGYGRIKQVVNDSLDALFGGGSPEPLFIRGEWGTGKTHFLSFVRGVAKCRDFPVARVDLNARSAPLNHPQRFYCSIAESVITAEDEGLQAVLSRALHSDVRARVRAFANSAEAGDIGAPLRILCKRFEGGEHLEVMDDPAWATLYGADLAWADYSYKRELATARIASLGRLFAALGKDGLIVLFDEVETIDQLWNVRSRMSAYGVLGQLCRAGAVWPIFGITERFDRTIDDDLARGCAHYDFATQSARWFVNAWQRREFTILEPPKVDSRNARTLARTVVKLYESAYDNLRADDRFIEQCVDDWLKNPARNPRRLIRMLIQHMDSVRELALPL